MFLRKTQLYAPCSITKPFIIYINMICIKMNQILKDKFLKVSSYTQELEEILVDVVKYMHVITLHKYSIFTSLNDKLSP